VGVGKVDAQNLANASLVALHGGQAIVEMGQSPTNFGALLKLLRTHFAGREFKFSIARGASTVDTGPLGVNGGVLFGVSAYDCAVSPTPGDPVERWPIGTTQIQLWPISRRQRPQTVTVTCLGAGETGWATQVLPTYMGR
jgi:hypothetical protein